MRVPGANAMVVAGAIGASVALGGGCGGDGEPLSTSEYRKQANALCAKQIRVVAGVPAPQGAGDLAQWLESGYDRVQPYAERSAELNPPDQFDSLHDRVVALRERDRAETDRVIEDLRSSDDPRKVFERELRADHTEQELTRVYRALELKRCVDLVSPPAGDGAGESRAPTADPSTCRDLVGEKLGERKELTEWVRDARKYQKTVDELAEEVRSYPEDRSEIELDLRSARRDVQEAHRGIREIQRGLEELDDEAREEGCGR